MASPQARLRPRPGVWVARNDRNRTHNGANFKDIPHLRKELPRQFDDATNRTIELIDVLWLESDAIIAAFEVVHTTAIYSGLLRMSDLVSMQPNIKLDLFMVAPDDRREKVNYEINRPTFARAQAASPEDLPVHSLLGTVEGDRADRKQNSLHEA